MRIYNIINIPKGLSPEFECDCREEYNSGYTEGLEEGFDKGYDSGYTDGAESVDCEDFYDSGYTDGYASGYTSGYTDGQESVDCTDFYNSGVTDGYASGYTSGRTDGYDDGWQPGYDSGRTDGEEAGYDTGYEEGRNYQKTLLVSTAITANGTYEREDGFNQVVVNVPSMSGAGYDSGYTDGYSSGYTDGSEDGFDSGYTSGVTDGYASGYTSGKTDAWQPAYDSGYTDGVASVDCQPLYDSGYTDGYSSGRTDGYDDGWGPGYNSGYTDGINAAGGDYASGYTDGFDAGYDSGVTDGYASGYTSGKTDGFGEGYDSGFTDGVASVDCQPLYDSGYTDGYESGHTDGYNERAAMLTAMTITANGVYESVEGWSAVTVNVPQTGRTESKEVYLSRADFPIIPPQAGIPEGEIWIGARKYYSPSSGYIGMDTFFLDAELNVTDIYVSGHTSGVTDGAAQQKALLSATTITQNGTYTRENGWSAVTVNVPQTGYTQEDLDNAYASGLTNGYNSGWTAGYDSGYTDGRNACSGVTPATGTTVLHNIYRTDDLNPDFLPSSATVLFQQDVLSAVTEMWIDGSAVTPSYVADFSGDAGRGGVRYHDVEIHFEGNTVPAGTFSANTGTHEGAVHLIHSTVSGDCTGIGDVAYWLCNIGTDYSRYPGLTMSDNIVLNLSGHQFGYTQLREVDIPTATTKIPWACFYCCYNLKRVGIHSGVTEIGSQAFQQVYALSSITIPASVEKIGFEAFETCTGLTSVIMEGETPPVLEYTSSSPSTRPVFNNTTCTFYVPANAVETYKAATGWSVYANRIQAIQ